MSEQDEPPIDYPEPTNYPTMPVASQPSAPALPPSDELSNSLAVVALVMALAGLVAVALAVPFALGALLVLVLGAGAVVVAILAANRSKRGVARGRRLAGIARWIGIADIALGLVLVLLRLTSA